MNREQAREVWEVIKAFGEGKTIQQYSAYGWVDVQHEITVYNGKVIGKYRIKPEENYTIEQNTGENRVEGGVLSVSGSISETHYCCECTRFQFCPIPSGETYKKACQKIKLKREFEERHYRPFNNCDELVETYHNRAFIPIVAEGLNQKLKRMYRPEIWVKEKETGIEQLITGFGDTVVKFSTDYTITLKSLFENYEFLDLSPCGCLEE